MKGIFLCYKQKKIFINAVLFLFIFSVFVLPGIFVTRSFKVPKLPTTFIRYILFISNIVFFAMLEELIYRIYLPKMFEFFFSYIRVFAKSNIFCISSLISHLLFALSHLYLGYLNVAFAFLASILLRWIYVYISKKHAILGYILISAIHAIYNIFVLHIIINFQN